MKSEFEQLRQAILAKFENGYFPNLNDFYTDFETNIKSLYKLVRFESKKDSPIINVSFKEQQKKKYRSNDFKNLFEDLNVEELPVSTIELLQPSETIPKSFLKDKENIKGKSIDYFVIYLGYKCWDSFLRYYPNPDIPKGDQQPELSKESKKNLESQDQNSLLTTDSTQIIGSLTIDNNFIEQILINHEYSKEQFYTSKFDDNCQWYGVIKGFDVRRNNYDTIKSTILRTMQEERTYKVSAIVSGDGGTGKSCLLRRAAIDLISEDFQILWLEDTYFEDFLKSGILQIEQHKSKKFLLFIEDWYRSVRKSKNIGRFLDKVKSRRLNNFRIIIGDRELDEETYGTISPSDVRFHLDFSENEHLLTKIASENHIWSATLKRLLASTPALESTSIFVLLFIISTLYEQNIRRLNLSEPEKAFQNIITYDLKQLEIVKPGFGIALIKSAFIYAKYGISISYDGFVVLVNKYSNRVELPPYYSNFKLDSQELRILRKYIHLSKPTKSQGIKLVCFNHDLLVSPGIIRIRNEREVFDDNAKFEILDTFTNKMQENYTPSVFLSKLIEQDSDIFIDDSHKLVYIEKLIEKKNWHQAYLLNLVRLDLKEDRFITYAEKILENEIYSNDFWFHYLRNHKVTLEIQNKLIELLLKDQEISNRVSILRQFSDDHRIKNMIRKIIRNAEITLDINNHFFEQCLILCDDSDIKIDFSKKLVNTEKVVEFIHPEIILCALKILEKTSTKSKICTQILRQYNDLEKIHPKVLVQLIKNGDRELTTPLSQFLIDEISESDTIKYDDQVIIQCLKVIPNYSVPIDFFKLIFQQIYETLDFSSYDLLIVCLKKCSDHELKVIFCDWVLSLWLSDPAHNINVNLLLECRKFCTDETYIRFNLFISNNKQML